MKSNARDELSPKAAEIVVHARELLAAGSYDSFSYADISDRVHISKASIHHHFASKSALVRVAVAQYREEARQAFAALDRQLADPVAELNAYVDFWSVCIRDGSSSFCICAMLAAELPTLPAEIASEVRGHFQDLVDWLAALLEKGRASGQFRLTGSPTIEAKAFMATAHGAMADARAFDDPSVFQEVMQLAMLKLTPVQ